MAKEKEIKLICGRLNKRQIQIKYWIDNTKFGKKIGDYAVVENGDGYDLVEVIAIVRTTKRLANVFAGTSEFKNVIDDCFFSLKNTIELPEENEKEEGENE